MLKRLKKIAVFGALMPWAVFPSFAQTPPPVTSAPLAAAAGSTAPAPAATAPAATPPKPAAGTPAKPGTAPAPPAAPAPEPTHQDGVAAVVNDAIITEYDVRQRTLLFLATSNQQATPENIAKLRSQILQQLTTEQLQIQEARRKGLTVSPTDVDKSIDRIINDNRLTREALTDLLAKGGVDMSTLRAQIAVQIAWQKAVQDEFQDRVNITPADVEAELARLSEGADKTHYLLATIFMAVENPDSDAKVQKDMQDIYLQLQQGANFGQVARQFSQSPTAAAGGDMGWVHEGQLPAELDAALKTMLAGAVTPPIRSTGGYYILGLRERQEGVNAVIPDPATQKPQGPLTVARLLLPVGPNPPKNVLENVMKLANQIHENIRGCEGLPKLQQQITGLIYQDLAKMGLAISDLAPDIQAAIQKAGPGETTPPFKSQAGIELMVRCDKRAPTLVKWAPPTRKQVEESLFDEQITALSRRYLRDLRRSANVEIK